MQFLRSKEGFPFSSAVIHSGKVLETVLTGQLPGETTPVTGGPAAEMQEIFRQLDEILAEAGLTKKNLCSAQIYLQDVNRDVAEINAVWADYLGDHPINRRCYGVDLQVGMLVEAGFVAEVPE
ncbi:MAG: RidA family protein [Arenicellales bacterium]|nr:RidA family protein [Arenicellales bacterium]